jgi:iron complex transport system substrate-binding protein
MTSTRTVTAAAILAALIAPAGAAPVVARPPAPVEPAAPQRIVCFIPAVTQMLFAIGAGPQVVAVGTFDREPPAVLNLPRVGGLLDPDTERILAMRPDLVVVYDGQQELEASLRNAGVRMYVYKHGDLASVTATMRELGRMVGHREEADRAAAQLESRLRAVADRVAGRSRPLTMLVFGREPHTLRNIYASGGYGFLHDILRIAGGRDVFADIARESVQPSLEEILARRPEAIVELRYGESVGTGDDMSPWKRLSALPAVRTNRLYVLVGDEFVEAGPRIADAAEKLSRVLHPPGESK